MSYPGRLRERVTVLKRAESSGRGRGSWIAGASRRCEIRYLRGDEVVLERARGRIIATVTVRMDAETRRWGAAERLRQDNLPSGQWAEFEITGEGVPDELGRWISFTVMKGISRAEDEG